MLFYLKNVAISFLMLLVLIITGICGIFIAIIGGPERFRFYMMVNRPSIGKFI